MNCLFSSSAGMIQVCQRICTYRRGQQGLNLSQRKTVIVPTVILTHGFEHALNIVWTGLDCDSSLIPISFAWLGNWQSGLYIVQD